MKEEIYKICTKLNDGQIAVVEAQEQLLLLFSVSVSLPNDDYWEARCKLMEQVEENNPCDPDITQGQIDAWSKYHNFIKERGQRQ